MSDQPEKIRLDKWLWHARFAKSRSIAAQMVTGGHVRVNSERASKPAQQVSPGAVLTFPLGNRVRVVRILAVGTRRGPAPEAQALYDDLSAPEDLTQVKDEAAANPRYEGKGRPTKRDRRRMERDSPDMLE